MKDQTSTSTPTEQIIQQLINAWSAQNKNVSAFFSKYADEAYSSEVAPGRNRAIYLLGHLVSTSDGMIPLLGLGERLFPELPEIFSASPDKAVANIPSLAELKQKWEKVTSTLTQHFSTLSTQEWLGRHMSVSEQDFALGPLRNKLSILISRTSHQSYHLGQLNLLKVKELVA